MTKNNTPEALQKIVEKLVVDLFKNDDCDNWECEECPFHLKEVEEDPYTVHMWLVTTQISNP